MSATAVSREFGAIVDELQVLLDQIESKLGTSGEPGTLKPPDDPTSPQNASDPDTAAHSAMAQSISDTLTNIRTAEKKVNSFVTRALRAIPDDLATTPLVEDTPQYKSLLEQAILRHMLHMGHKTPTKLLLNESRLLDNYDSARNSLAIYDTLDTILADLDAGNVDPALEWAEKHREFLEKSSSPLFHDLNLLILDHKLATDRFAALGFLRQVGTLPFGRHSQRIPLMLLDHHELLDLKNLNAEPAAQARESFRWWYLLFHGYSPVSQLYLAAHSGLVGLPHLAKSNAIMKLRNAEWTSLDELPVDIPLPQDLQFHPVFVCPVSKEQTSTMNPPYLLPCGHVLAEATITHLRRAELSIQIVKCPYCPKRASMDEIERIVFSSE